MAEMFNDSSHILTQLTRLARGREEGSRWLEGAFERKLEKLALPALDVAVETGDPVGRVLAYKIEKDHLSEATTWKIYRKLPAFTVTLRELAAIVTTMLLDMQHVPRFVDAGDVLPSR